MPTATLISEQLDGWAPGTRHYTCSGKHLAVEATVPDGSRMIPQGAEPMINDLLVVMGESRAALKIVARPTVVFLCTENGEPVDADENDHDPLTPLHSFPAGTTHDAALAQLGYTVS